MNQKCYALRRIIHEGGEGTSYSELKILCVDLYVQTLELRLRVIYSTSNDEFFQKTPMIVIESFLIEKENKNP